MKAFTRKMYLDQGNLAVIIIIAFGLLIQAPFVHKILN